MSRSSEKQPFVESGPPNLSERFPMKQAPLAERHPFAYVTLLEFAVIAVYLVVGTIAHFARLSDQGVTAIANIALSALAAGLLTCAGLVAEGGLQTGAQTA